MPSRSQLPAPLTLCCNFLSEVESIFPTFQWFYSLKLGLHFSLNMELVILKVNLKTQVYGTKLKKKRGAGINHSIYLLITKSIA